MADHTRASSPRLSRRTALTVALVVLLVATGGLTVWRTTREPEYVGTSRRVTLRWQCGNGIFWPRNSDRPWWAGHSPVADGAIDTSTSASTGALRLITHVATGTLTFVSRSEAKFRSDAGGSLLMKRQRSNAVYSADCVGGSLPTVKP